MRKVIACSMPLILMTLALGGCGNKDTGVATATVTQDQAKQLGLDSTGASRSTSLGLPIYNAEDAYTMVRLAQIVYQHGDDSRPDYTSEADYQTDLVRMQNDARSLGYNLVAPFLAGSPGVPPTGQVFAAVFENSHGYVLAYRGTVGNSLANILADLNFVLTPWPSGGHVHRGDYAVEEQTWPAVQAFFSQAIHQDRPVWITGHSLGAAVATLAASHMAHVLPQVNIEKIYVYAQARPGDLAFVEGFARDGLEQRFIKFAHDDDLVNILPAASLGFADTRNIVLLSAPNTLRRIDEDYQSAGALQFDALVGHNFAVYMSSAVPDLPLLLHANIASFAAGLGIIGKEPPPAAMLTLLSSQLGYAVAVHDIKTYIAILAGQR